MIHSLSTKDIITNDSIKMMDDQTIEKNIARSKNWLLRQFEMLGDGWSISLWFLPSQIFMTYRGFLRFHPILLCTTIISYNEDIPCNGRIVIYEDF